MRRPYPFTALKGKVGESEMQPASTVFEVACPVHRRMDVSLLPLPSSLCSRLVTQARPENVYCLFWVVLRRAIADLDTRTNVLVAYNLSSMP